MTGNAYSRAAAAADRSPAPPRAGGPSALQPREQLPLCTTLTMRRRAGSGARRTGAARGGSHRNAVPRSGSNGLRRDPGPGAAPISRRRGASARDQRHQLSGARPARAKGVRDAGA
jgi:hypothetical protein